MAYSSVKFSNYTEKKNPISECIKRFRFEKRRVISGTRFLYHIKPQTVDDRDVYRLKAQKGMGP